MERDKNGRDLIVFCSCGKALEYAEVVPKSEKVVVTETCSDCKRPKSLAYKKKEEGKTDG